MRISRQSITVTHMDADWQPLPPVIPPQPPQPLTAPRRRSYGLGTVLATAVASAVLAAAATVNLLNLAAPGAVPSPSPAAAAGSPAASRPDATPAGASPAAARISPGAGASGGAATEPAVARSPGQDPNSVIVAVAARVSPAVVTITSNIAASQFDPFAVPSSGVGSGFIFAPAGWILTNNHVVEGATTVTVSFKGSRDLVARVVATDPAADLAVIKVNATDLPTVEIGTSADLQVGQLLIAIGSPLGTYSDSVTSGILSATGRSITVRDETTRQRRQMTNLLQTDAAINPGNSGGPLLDARGRVIGINSAVATSAEGIGFAIPIDAARAIMAKAVATG
jgi:S1-C subfamily serine protease